MVVFWVNSINSFAWALHTVLAAEQVNGQDVIVNIADIMKTLQIKTQCLTTATHNYNGKSLHVHGLQ